MVPPHSTSVGEVTTRRGHSESGEVVGDSSWVADTLGKNGVRGGL